MAITQTQILNLIVSMYNAAPGAANLSSLNAIVAANSATYTLANLADDLAAGDLYKSQYTNMDNTAKADSMMATFGYTKNVFGLFDTTEEIAAYNYFTTELAAGKTTQSIQTAASEYLVSAANTTFTVGKATLENKSSVSEHFSVTKAKDGSTLAELQSALSGVTSDTDTVTTAKTAIDALGTVTGSTISLTDGVDNLTGTSADDMFTAGVVQAGDKSGAITNQFATGDVVDGGAGTKDELFAKVKGDSDTNDVDSSQEITADTKNVEIVRLEVIDEAVEVDAGSLDGVKEYWSDDSEGDLTINDVRLGTGNSVTKDITFGIKDTDGGNATTDFTARFDSASLTNAGTVTSNSVITYENAYESPLPTGLDATTVTKGLYFQVNFTGTDAAGTSKAFASGFFQTDGTTYAHTYAGAAAKLDSLLDAAGFTNLTVDASQALTTITTNSGVKTVDTNAKKIIITDPAGNAFSSVTTGTGQDATAGVTSSDTASTSYTTDPSSSTTLIETNLVLDNAGRGSTMGNVEISGESNSDKAPEQINIFVDRSSAISTLTTDASNGTIADSELQKVVISSTGSTLKTTIDGKGDLEINSIKGWDNTVSNTIDATAFTGANLMLGDTVELTGTTAGIVNVETINANTSANVTVLASTSETVEQDTNGVYTVTTGSGNDNVTYDLDGDSVDARGESFAITTNGGNDTVTMNLTAGVSLDTMKELSNLTISLGAGDDKLLVNDYGTFNVTAGEGSDFVEFDANDATDVSGDWTVGQTTAIQTWSGSTTATEDRVLYKASMTVSFAGFESKITIATTSTDNFVANQELLNTEIVRAIAASPELSKLLSTSLSTGNQQLKIASLIDGENTLSIGIYQPGLESTAGVALADGEVLIDSSDVSALGAGLRATEAQTSDTTTTAQQIETFTDTAGNNWFGSIDATGDGNVELYSTDRISHDTVEIHNNTHDDAVDIFDDATGGQQYSAYSLGNATASANDTTMANFSTIDLGNGTNDIVVLDSDVDSMQTIKVSSTFGKVSVVNFFDGAISSIGAAAAANGAGVMGEHLLDFSTYLTDKTDASAVNASNTTSAVTANVDVVTVTGAKAYTGNHGGSTDGNTVSANDVAVLRFDSDIDATETFALLTSTNLLAALNNTTTVAYGNLDNALLESATQATLVGTTQNHILMVENDLNAGEYKVFHLTSTVTTAGTTGTFVGDFATATELGTMDFGDSINVNMRGNATNEATLATAIATAQTAIDTAATAAAATAALVTTVNVGQTVTASNTVTNANGASVDVSTIKTIDAAATLTATSAQAAMMSGVTGGITLSNTVSATVANPILGQFSGAVTATLSSGTASAINTALTNGATTDVLTFAVTDTTGANLADLNALALKTTGAGLITTSTVTAVTGSVAEANTYATDADTDFSHEASAVTLTVDEAAAGTVAAQYTTVNLGNFANTIVMQAAATVVGGTLADNITAGTGADTITGGTGADTIILGAAGDIDTVKFNTYLDGAASAVTITDIAAVTDDFTATAGTTTDSITGFTENVDLIKIDGALKAMLEAAGATVVTSGGDGTTLDYNATGILIISGAADTKLANDNFGDVSAIATAFNTEVTAANAAAGDEILFSVENNTGDTTGLYYLKFGAANATGQIAATDTISLLGIIATDDLVAADITVA